MTLSGTALLDRLERYYDEAPRAVAEVEQHGPFSLFIARTGWPYYARPRLGHSAGGSASDVLSVLARQRELDVPRSVEWVHEVTPWLLTAATQAGMTVARCPLLVLAEPHRPHPSAGEMRRMTPDDPDLPAVVAAVAIGFGSLGTAVGEPGLKERDAAVAAGSGHPEGTRTAVARGLTVQVGAFLPGAGAVGGGAHNPRGDVSEVVGVAVLPAYRRRGLAAAITAALTDDALSAGVRTVFCSAESEQVAHIYQGIGFQRVGTACIAEMDG